MAVAFNAVKQTGVPISGIELESVVSLLLALSLLYASLLIG
jgi:hypothetical protein